MSTDTANPPSSTPITDHDSPWKEAREHFFPEFLALLFPAIHADKLLGCGVWLSLLICNPEIQTLGASDA
jgi:hypothetical protein